jgi:hypothetical protein
MSVRSWSPLTIARAPRRLGEGEEVVVVRVSADRRAVRRIRDSVAAPGDLSDEGSAFLCSGVPAELGSLEDRGQLGQEQGTGGDLDPLVDHRLPQFRWIALRGDEGRYEHGRVEYDPIHYEAALP